jgi:hypothetical protein
MGIADWGTLRAKLDADEIQHGDIRTRNITWHDRINPEPCAVKLNVCYDVALPGHTQRLAQVERIFVVHELQCLVVRWAVTGGVDDSFTRCTFIKEFRSIRGLPEVVLASRILKEIYVAEVPSEASWMKLRSRFGPQ